MKCEKCNANEANFYYKSTVNGVTTEMHLCTQCAMEEGLGNSMDFGSGFMFDSMLGGMLTMRPGMLPVFGSYGGFGRGIKAPGVSFPQIDLTTGTDVPQSPGNEILIPADAGDEIKSKRELSALKYQLEAAVEAEDFEKAVQIRDIIRKMEN
jgi:protein arginine kinase activator